MKKIISFSLWGNNPKYTVGAIRNAELAPLVYPGWKTRFYIANTVPDQILYALEDLEHVEIIYKDNPGDWTGMFWRFQSCYDDNVDVSIFRDTDSRLNKREKLAVDEWLRSDKLFHIMRDHPFHKYPILGGMWGIKSTNKFNIKLLLEDFMQNKATDSYGTDYNFLGNVLYPLIKDKDCFIHDEFFSNRPFPAARSGYEFVGQVFDENEKTVQEHLEAIKNFKNK